MKKDIAKSDQFVCYLFWDWCESRSVSSTDPGKPLLFPKTSSAWQSFVFQDVFNTYLQNVLQKRLREVFQTSSQDVFKTFSRRLQDVFQTSSRRVKTCLQDVFFKKTPKTSSRHLQDVFSTSLQTRNFAGTLHKKWTFLLKSCSVNVTKSVVRIWSHLLKKILMENFIFCTVLWWVLTLNSFFVGLNNYGIIQNTAALSNAVRNTFIIIIQDCRIRGDNQILHKKWSFSIKNLLGKCDQILNKSKTSFFVQWNLLFLRINFRKVLVDLMLWWFNSSILLWTWIHCTKHEVFH